MSKLKIMNCKDPLKRFLYYSDRTGDCWLWLGSLSGGADGNGGWGSLRIDGKAIRAHRWAYEHFIGPIPEGMVLDHLCRTRRCVNPKHLEPVTHRENVLRGVSPYAINAAKTHCKYGHEFTPENTKIPRTRPTGRECITCMRLRAHGGHPEPAKGGTRMCGYPTHGDYEPVEESTRPPRGLKPASTNESAKAGQGASNSKPVEYPSSSQVTPQLCDFEQGGKICGKPLSDPSHGYCSDVDNNNLWAHPFRVGSEVKPRTGDKQDFCPEIRMNSVCCGRYNENGVCQKCGITRDEPRTGEGS